MKYLWLVVAVALASVSGVWAKELRENWRLIRPCVIRSSDTANPNPKCPVEGHCWSDRDLLTGKLYFIPGDPSVTVYKCRHCSAVKKVYREITVREVIE